MAQLIDLMKGRQVGVIIHANFVDAAPARRLAEMTGAQVLSLPAAVCASDSVNSYNALFESVLLSLEEATR